MKILVVDDDDNARVYLSDLLEAQEYAVVAATNGREGLKAAKASPPDMIVSDIMMPEMDGFDLCRRVKSDELLSAVPFIFYSATYTDERDEKFAMELGASRFIVKPKEVDELVGEIREVVEEHKADRLPVPTRPEKGEETLDDMHVGVVTRKLQKKIEELEQTVRARKASEAVLKATLESTQDGVLVVSKDGTISHYNSHFQELWSIPPEVMASRSDQKLINFVLPQLAAPDEFVAKIRERYQDSGISEDIIQLKDDRIFERISAPHIQDGRETGRVWFFRDITERKRAEVERERLITHLEAQNTELERFAYTVSHDLRTPLITINNYSGALRHDLREGNTGQAADDAQRIGAAGEAMCRLLDDVLELSRIGRVVNPPEDVLLSELVRDVLALLASRISAHGVRVEIADDLPILFGDCEKVLQNLIENALKYMGQQPEPRVEIGVRQEGSDTVCYIRDNGIGIEERYQERIFGLFDQLDQTVDGSGIGLALVKRIVEIHGGRVWCESEGKGCGSTFCFAIPAERDDTANVMAGGLF